MFVLQRLFAGFSPMFRSVRLVLLLLCLATVVYPALTHLSDGIAKAGPTVQVFAQSSPLSPLDTIYTAPASAEAETAAAPALNQGGQTSLVLVAFVLVGVLVVVGLVMWRQR